MFSYRWDFHGLGLYMPYLWRGVGVTLELSALAILFTLLFGSLLGMVLGVVEDVWTKRTLILGVDVIRSIPLIVLMLWFYYFLPAIGLARLSPFWPAVIALIVNNSVFFADIIRGSIEGLPKGSIMAAEVLGMNQGQILRRIIMPEVYRETFASTTLTAVTVIRYSALASILSVSELTHSADYVISTTYKPLEVYTIITGIYLLVILPLTLLARWLEKYDYFRRRAI